MRPAAIASTSSASPKLFRRLQYISAAPLWMLRLCRRIVFCQRRGPVATGGPGRLFSLVETGSPTARRSDRTLTPDQAQQPAPKTAHPIVFDNVQSQAFPMIVN